MGSLGDGSPSKYLELMRVQLGVRDERLGFRGERSHELKEAQSRTLFEAGLIL